MFHAFALLALCVPARSAQASLPKLRDLARRRGIWIGTAVRARSLSGDEPYGRTLARQFDIVTPENAMKFAIIHPARGRYDFSGADAVVSFAQRDGMLVRGHNLAWYHQIPSWVTDGRVPKAELASVLREHIAAVVGRYKGRVYAWDVVNEAIDDHGAPRSFVWSQGDPDYIADAFRWARAADPDAKLFYNEYGLESNKRKAEAVFKLLSDMKKAGVPVDGIGLQMHLRADGKYGDFRPLIARFASLGLEVHITELDVALPGPPTAELLEDQAELYGRVMDACLAEKACKAFVMWGFTDKYDWRRSFSDIMDAQCRPKPAFDALRRALLK